MTIEQRDYGYRTGNEVSMTACPYCDEEIGKHENFVQHWPRCPANPEEDEDDA